MKMTIGLQRIEEHDWDVTIADGDSSGLVAHGLGITPGAAKVSVKPKSGTDPAGDTITVTTDATNITLTAQVGPIGGDWVFEAQYVEGL